MDNAPSLPTRLADAAEQRPTTPRIPEIVTGNSPSDLGFQESDLDGTHDGIGFQESRQERIIVWWISEIQVGNGQDLVEFRESELKHKEFERVFPEKYNKGITIKRNKYEANHHHHPACPCGDIVCQYRTERSRK